MSRANVRQVGEPVEGGTCLDRESSVSSQVQCCCEQRCSEGKAERRSRFCIEMVDRGCHGPTPVTIEGSALLKAFKLVPETANEVKDLIRRRSPYSHALSRRPKSRRDDRKEPKNPAN